MRKKKSFVSRNVFSSSPFHNQKTSLAPPDCICVKVPCFNMKIVMLGNWHHSLQCWADPMRDLLLFFHRWDFQWSGWLCFQSVCSSSWGGEYHLLNLHPWHNWCAVNASLMLIVWNLEFFFKLCLKYFSEILRKWEQKL